MKRTPEQEAWMEYGKARGRLEGRREEFIIPDIVFGISKQEAIASFRKHYPVRSALVKDALKKRTALRITCSECETYNVELKDSFKNIWCPYAEIYTNGKTRCVGCPCFKPRKEGGMSFEEIIAELQKALDALERQGKTKNWMAFWCVDSALRRLKEIEGGEE